MGAGTVPPSPVTPGCTIGCQRTTCSFGGGDKGAIPTPGVSERLYNSLQLFYFPETRNVSRDMCAQTPTGTPVPFPTTDASTYIPITTEGYAVVDGRTLYKGNVYISVAQMEVADNCDYTTVMEDVIFPVASSDVQSERSDARVYPVQWADFNEPVPYSAALNGLPRTFSAIDPAMVTDRENYCKTAICDRAVVYPDNFNPWILLPPAVKHLDPDFADCDLRYDLSFFDPPIALSEVPNFLTTTAPDPLPTPAKPASSAIAIPVQTGDAHYTGPPASQPTPGGQIPNESACHISTCPSNQGPASGSHGSDNARPGLVSPALPIGNNDASDTPNAPDDPNTPGAPNASDAPYTPDAPDAPDAPNAPGDASRTRIPAAPARPQITVGPTIIPIAPDGQGIIIQSPTTFDPSGSAVIGGTTFHLSTGVLTMVSSGGEPSTLTIGGASQNAIGTIVALNNGAFTIQTSASALVFNIQTTLKIGDPIQTVGDMIYSIGSDGVRITNTRNGEETSIPLSEIEALATGQALDASGLAALLGAKPTTPSADEAGALGLESEPTLTGLGSDGSQLGGQSGALAKPVATASASKLGSAGSTGSAGPNSDEGSEGSDPSSSSNDVEKGAAASVSIPRHVGLLSVLMLVLYL